MKIKPYLAHALRSGKVLRREVVGLHRMQREQGVKTALLHRLKVLLSLEDLTNDAYRAETNALNERISRAEGQIALANNTARAETVASLSAANARLSDTLHTLTEEHKRLHDRERLAAWEQFLATLDVPETFKISVILATRNRATELVSAIRSVQQQTYANWELVIADDGSTDATAEYLESLNDARIQVLRQPAHGVSAARNGALAAASGDVITYLDDDNALHAGWLKAVAWAFCNHPETTVLYGARIAETTAMHADRVQVVWDVFERNRLLQNNFIDMGSIAHRAGLSEASFDEELDACVDWDLMLRLTRSCEPLRLPHVSHFYRTGAANRISDRREPHVASERVRRKHRPPLRVLFYEAMYPLRTETYMTDESDALRARGIEIACARKLPSAGPMPVDIPVFNDIDKAIAEFKPDALMLHWATHAVTENSVLARLGMPYAVRVHSYDAHASLVASLQSDPLCFGVWAFPQFARRWPGTHSLAAIFPNTELFKPGAESVRRGVSIIAASLPKRNWPLVHRVFEQLPGVEKRIVLGTTNEWEHLPFDLLKECTRRGHGAIVQVNMDRADVATLLKRTSVALYTLEEAQRDLFGMPQTILEAMFSGASVVVPNWPLAHEICGPSARYYDTDEDIVRHVLACEAGGPAIEAERVANREWAMRLCGGPEHADGFAAQLIDRYDAWRQVHQGLRQNRAWPHVEPSAIA